ncbi:MAG TPA: hypothetical protein RMG48_06575 [Myxococcales bacterium LLY-WYZ-16_1]|nr:hypothetical protein [Myxococcales bacterium LLY-WYZ-16_1]
MCERSHPWIRAALVAAAFGLAAAPGFTVAGATPAAAPAEPSGRIHSTANSGPVLCSYFVRPNTRRSYCSRKPLAEAQKECNARLKKEGLEGTCACTDDPDYIDGRCD